MARKRKTTDYGNGDDHGERYEEQPSAVRVHEAYLEHRRSTSPPDPEAYRRALEQFQALPGAVLPSPAPPRPKEPGQSDEEADKERPEERSKR
jgi:hypothetical protein